jgi:hypothetical protein
MFAFYCIYCNVHFSFIIKYEEEDQIEDQIVDASLDNDHMANINGYFENLTSALLFCWIQKHNIC